MSTLREVIIENVGTDVATEQWMTEALGYWAGSLNSEAKMVHEEEGMSIWTIPGGWHVSTPTTEQFSDDLVADGFLTQEEWDNEW